MGNKNKLTKVDKLIYCCLFFLSSLIGFMLLSKAVSPLYDICGGDSAIFLTIGKYWSEGVIPYKEMFDHKGPIIFFINAIGYSLWNNKLGVFVIEVIFGFVAEIFLFNIMIEYYSKAKSVLLTIMFPFFLAYNWGSGNLTEGYILPFLIISLYYMLKWNEQIRIKQYEHFTVAAFIYGITIGFALMTRLTNAMGIILGVTIIVLFLIKKKLWKNLWHNAVAFIFGNAVVVLPFCIYFAHKNCSYEMWYATLLYNLEYTANSGMDMPNSLRNLIQLLRMSWAGWILVFVSVGKMITERNFKSFFWFVIAGGNMILICSLNCTSNYSICLIPYLYIVIIMLAPNREINYKHNRLDAILLAGIIMISIINSSYYLIRNPLGNNITNNSKQPYEALVEMVPYEERDSFTAVDCPTALYLNCNIKPECKYFIHQSWQASCGKSMEKRICKEFNELKSKWILVNVDNEHELVIRDVIEADYKFVSEVENYRLYKLCL